MLRPVVLRPIVLVILVACARPVASQPRAAKDGEFGHAHIGIVTVRGDRYALNVEVAKTEAQREQGLMYRRELAQNAGMIFLFDEPQNQTFWMKNTLIPLDMIFIGADGIIVGIVPDATPETETVRSVGVPSQYVLEVNAGWAALKGVRIGDRVDVSDALAAAR